MQADQRDLVRTQQLLSIGFENSTSQLLVDRRIFGFLNESFLNPQLYFCVSHERENSFLITNYSNYLTTCLTFPLCCDCFKIHTGIRKLLSSHVSLRCYLFVCPSGNSLLNFLKFILNRPTFSYRRLHFYISYESENSFFSKQLENS